MDTHILLPAMVFAPLVFGVVILFIKNFKWRKPVVFTGVLVTAAMAILTVVQISPQLPFTMEFDSPWIDYGMLAIETGIALLVVAMSIRAKRWLPVVLALAQTGLALWYDLSLAHGLYIQSNIVIDQLSMIMLLVIGVVGGLIGVFATGYMKIWQEENPGAPDRRRLFFFVIFAFMSGMYGLVITNNLKWMHFFWEITTLASFLLIGYPKTKEAERNSFKALNMNLLGGLAFIGAIVFLAYFSQTVELNRLSRLGIDVAMVPICLLAIAGLTKSAQLPFSSWLLGAMVAPTPVSALLHSATMVKAGIYLLIRLAPRLSNTVPGNIVAIIGGLTFLIGAFAAISPRNSKRVLAWSTISNLGLIVACCGLGTPALIWVSIFLLIFHASSKALMFLTVGTASVGMHSLEIDDMAGLVRHMPRVATMMLIGICGMFVAPFGMLIAKWAALEAFVDLKSLMGPLMVTLLAFGSSTTIFFWTKWMGPLMRIRDANETIKRRESHMTVEELVSEALLSVLTVASCVLFPLVSQWAVNPYLMSHFNADFDLGRGNVVLMMMMMGMIVVIPAALMLAWSINKKKRDGAYMSGRNVGPGLSFEGSAGIAKRAIVSSLYLEKIFDEGRLLLVGQVLCVLLVVILGGVAFL